MWGFAASGRRAEPGHGGLSGAPRAGLSAQVVIEHGDGDAAWAAQAARDMAQMEQKFNQPTK